jgi:hypothetical protein
VRRDRESATTERKRAGTRHLADRNPAGSRLDDMADGHLFYLYLYKKVDWPIDYCFLALWAVAVYNLHPLLYIYAASDSCSCQCQLDQYVRVSSRGGGCFVDRAPAISPTPRPSSTTIRQAPRFLKLKQTIPIICGSTTIRHPAVQITCGSDHC